MMKKQTAFLLCLLAALAGVHCNVLLTKQIEIDQSPRPTLRNVADQIRNTDIRGEMVKMIFTASEETFLNLDGLLAAKTNPEVSEVLDIFNVNFGVKLLVVNGDNIQVDSRAYQQFLSNKALSLVKTLFPKNVFQQFAAYGVLQQQIQRTVKDLRPQIDSRSIPVDALTSVIATNGRKIAKRDIFSDLFVSVETAICNSVVSYAYSQLNTTLTSLTEFIDSVSISSGDSIIVALITVALDYVNELIEGFQEIAAALSSSLCSDIFSSSRKRRDVDDSALAEFGTRDILTRDIFSTIFDFIWSLIAPLFNSTLKLLFDSLVSLVESYITSFLEGSFTDYIYSIIDSVF